MKPRKAWIDLADASKAAACLGWTPRYSSLENIVATAWRWHRKHDGR